MYKTRITGIQKRLKKKKTQFKRQIAENFPRLTKDIKLRFKSFGFAYMQTIWLMKCV